MQFVFILRRQGCSLFEFFLLQSLRNNSLEAGAASTKCEKIPFPVCGRGCLIKKAEEECFDQEVESLVDIPKETCDLQPMKTCKFVTKLIPSLKPQKECTQVPSEVCNLEFTQAKKTLVPLRTEWCLDDEEEKQKL